MDILPQKRQAPADEDRQVEDRIEEGRVRKKGRFEKAVSIDPFDLPDDVLHQIFKTGTSLHLAEQVSEKWRSKIQSTPEFWKNACTRLSVNEGNITQLLRQRLKVKSKKSKYSNKALVWREIWLKYRQRICQYCQNFNGSEYPLFDNIVLCDLCKKLEPYNAVTENQAIYFFKMHSMKVLRRSEVRLLRFYDQRSTKSSPMGYSIVRLYRFTELVEMAQAAFGEVFAKTMVDKYRRYFLSKKMQGHLREL